MAGLTAAWRLSEPGWRDELESITVYQRGWRLGGKGASSRGPNGRIEEHGLHLWLGYYENAFRLLRECYAELDRPATDPEAPIQTWRDAIFPAPTVGARGPPARTAGTTGSGSSRRTTCSRASPTARGRELTLGDVLRRALQLVADFLESLPDDGDRIGRGGPQRLAPMRPPARARSLNGLRVSVLAAILEAPRTLRGRARPLRRGVLGARRSTARSPRRARRSRAWSTSDPDLRRTWHLVAVMTAAVRAGCSPTGSSRTSRGFRALNDEDFLDWISAPRRAARGRRLPVHPRALRPRLRRAAAPRDRGAG